MIFEEEPIYGQDRFDRLLQLSQKQVAIVVRPILGGVLRLPERFKDRDELEQNYFLTDAARTADFLDLPYATPNPSPITFKPGSLWVAEDEQPRNEYLYRLFVGSTKAGYGLEFLDKVARTLWDGSTLDWDQDNNLEDKMGEVGLDLEAILSSPSWENAKQTLDQLSLIHI